MDKPQRIASSEIMSLLFGDISQFRGLLMEHTDDIIAKYGGETILSEHFQPVSDRIICICPMVLCNAFLVDVQQKAPADLLGPLGLAMYSISTHDDIVDEQPPERDTVAGLVYSGNIASLHGISLLISNGYGNVAQEIIHMMNVNHCFQTDIILSIWRNPSNEKGYLKAISHTGYWAGIGPVAAARYSNPNNTDLISFALKFGEYYGRMCQVYDDIREIDDDVKNGYFSLPISIALDNGYDLEDPLDRIKAIARPKEIAEESFNHIRGLCGAEWKNLLYLAEKMHNVGQKLSST